TAQGPEPRRGYHRGDGHARGRHRRPCPAAGGLHRWPDRARRTRRRGRPMIAEAFRLAARSIVRNKLRSFLTILGIVIGVAAVIAMVTVGQGSSKQVSASVEAMGSDVLVLRPGRREFGPPGASGRARRFTLRDAEALVQLS